MCDSNDSGEPPRKKLHKDAPGDGESPSQSEKNGNNNRSNGIQSDSNRDLNKASTIPAADAATGGVSAPAADFSKLEVVRVLSCSDSNCSVAVEAKHCSEAGRVLVQMQKTPFNSEKLTSIVSGDTHLTQLFHNDVYSKHTAQLPPSLNEVQVTVIHPALDKHFQRYEKEFSAMVEETPELYAAHTKPFMDSAAAHSKQWIYNILSGESESDRVILREPCPATGFVLLPDLKWTGLQSTDLYLLALVNRRDLGSIRDLTGDCLPLLRNIRDKGTKAIEDKYGVEKNRLRIYFHYLPSFYHLHVHFSALTFDAPGTWCGKAHLLCDVISNLQHDPDHYRKATLAFTVKDNHPHPLAFNNINQAAGDSVDKAAGDSVYKAAGGSTDAGAVKKVADNRYAFTKSKDEKDKSNEEMKASGTVVE